MSPDALRAWRKDLRAALIERRMGLDSATLDAHRRSIDHTLSRAFPNLHRGVVAFCWPFRNEYDARFIARTLRDRGATTALPVVVAPRQPLEFREWHPGVPLARGVYDIPYPAAGPAILPHWVLLPMNGFDDAGYRLGYGGGFFDRTLARLIGEQRKPVVIGVTYELAHLETIHPQSYDIPMDFVVTERGLYERRDDHLEFLGMPPAGDPSALASPVCYASELDPSRFGGSS